MLRYRKYYMKLSYKELRRRQNLARQQIIYANRDNKDGRRTRGIIRLQRVYDLLSNVIMTKFLG